MGLLYMRRVWWSGRQGFRRKLMNERVHVIAPRTGMTQQSS